MTSLNTGIYYIKDNGIAKITRIYIYNLEFGIRNRIDIEANL